MTKINRNKSGVFYLIIFLSLQIMAYFSVAVAVSVHTNFPILNDQIPHNIYSSPTNFDYDQDGDVEVIIGSGDEGLEDGELYIINSDGEIELSFASPSFNAGFPGGATIADIDRDNRYEIIFGGLGAMDMPYLYVKDEYGNDKPGFPVPCEFAGMITDAPLIYDVNGDGYKEIIFLDGLGCPFQGLWCYSHDGNAIWGAEADCHMGPPVIGDADGDFIPEVFVVGKGWWQVPPVLRCFDARDGSEKWSYQLNQHELRWGSYGTALGDIDWDGDLEIVITTQSYPGDEERGGIMVFDAANGGPPIFERDIYGRSFSPPVVGNIAGDEKLEIVAGGRLSYSGELDDAVYCWNYSGDLLWSIGINDNPLFFGTTASFVLASFSTTSTPDYCVLANVQKQDIEPRESSVWLLDGDDGSVKPGYPAFNLFFSNHLST